MLCHCLWQALLTRSVSVGVQKGTVICGLVTLHLLAVILWVYVKT